MEHPNATRIRTSWLAAMSGDPVAAAELATDDVVWINDIGAGPWRRLDGLQACGEFALAWQELFDFTWTYDVLDACGSDHSAVLVMREHGFARGHHFDNHTLYHFTLGPDGRATHIQTYDRDRDAIIAFWEAIGPVTP